MLFELQPTLENEFIKILPLKEDEFEALYAVASDPLIWEQHPNKNRYQREDFLKYFEGAIASKGAFLVFNNKTGVLIGGSRYYDLDEAKSSVAIGYTFLACDHWGTTHNRALKTLMLNHAFCFVNEVIFHVGANNTRSQKAMEKLGAIKIDEIEMAYYGEPNRFNFVYQVTKEFWEHRNT
jgi:RimJ/RimL family protein N-acetyltransferase